LYGIRDILSEYVSGCFIHQTYRVASAISTHPLSFWNYSKWFSRLQRDTKRI